MKIDRRTWLYMAGSAALILLALVLIVAAVSAGYQAPAGEEQPKVTDWMQAWAGVAGVVAGTAAAVAATALLLFERQQAQDARQQLAEERRTAEESRARAVISARVIFPPGGYAIGANAIRCSRIELSVHNFGADPIHWVAVEVKLPDGRTVEHNGSEFIGPGTQELVAVDLNPPYTCMGDNPTLDAKLCSVVVAFNDSSGIRWSRKDNQAPSRRASGTDIA
ncbi:hypothetical protein [Micromonospora sp. NPDC049799]|uniref:hypothetical protein n=1 Tax=Micromonospora sp. NPDC049799 TaxID=3154741 RepID=UPI00340C5D96